MQITLVLPPVPLTRDQRKYQKHKEQIKDRTRAYFHRRKLEIQKDLHPCECGCGTPIPKLTSHNKPCRFKKGHIHRVKEHSPETIQKWKDAREVAHNALRGKARPDTSQRLREWHLDPSFRAKLINSIRTAHTRIEDRLLDVIKRRNLPFEYTGDGAKMVSGINPDFCHISDKVVLEAYGLYWHSPLFRPAMASIQRPDVRYRIYQKAGYRCIAFWEYELLSPHHESIIMNRLDEFAQQEVVVRI